VARQGELGIITRRIFPPPAVAAKMIATLDQYRGRFIYFADTARAPASIRRTASIIPPRWKRGCRFFEGWNCVKLWQTSEAAR